jgi:hypothetical protein
MLKVNYTNDYGVEYVSVTNEDGSGYSMTLAAYNEKEQKKAKE